MDKGVVVMPVPVAAARPVILLDAGGVLLLPTAARLAEALTRWGARPQAADDATTHYSAVASFDRTGDILDYRRAYGRALGLRGRNLEAAVRSSDAWRVPWQTGIPSATRMLRSLIEGGIDIAIVSNSDGSVARQLTDSGVCQVGRGPLPAVLAVCDSATVGAAKPNPRIFDFARQAVGGSRRILGHVGDSLREDVHGALAAGLTPFHMDPLHRCADRGHEHLTSLAALDVGRLT